MCVILLSDDDAVSVAVFFGRNKGLFIVVLIIKRARPLIEQNFTGL